VQTTHLDRIKHIKLPTDYLPKINFLSKRHGQTNQESKRETDQKGLFLITFKNRERKEQTRYR
jgi:hypothetical protein